MQLNVREWGDAKAHPVVCIHGLTGYGGRFRRLACDFLLTHRVIAVDLRGHGDSGWEPPWDLDTHVADLLETADALGISSATWLGHSIGGRLVAHVAAAHPERVERAVLLDPAMQVDPAVATERVELLRRDASFATAAEAVDTRIADPTLYTTPRGVVEAEAAEHLYARDDGRLSWRFYPPMAIVAWSEMTTAAPPWPRCPTLLLVGARSWITPAASVPPNVSLVTVPGGHAVMWDDFDATAAAVSAFVGGPSRLSG